MIQLKFTEEDLEIIRHERYHHPHPHVMKKMEVLHLKSLELPHKWISLIAGVCSNTMRDYFAEYIEGGIEKVKQVNFYRPKSEMSVYATSIEAHLKDHPPASISQASAMIEELTGIKRGITQTRSFLKSLGFSFRKAGAIPSKAITAEKKRNSENIWTKN